MLRDINTVFIMTGYDCNLDCKYCMQRDAKAGAPQKMHNITLVTDYLENLAARQEQSFNVHFYGGEPLLQFDVIQQIIAKLKNISNINFTMITNGTLITNEVLAYLNENEVGVCVSWDGKNVIETRGVDVLKENANILKLNRLQISAVLSSQSYFSDIFEELYQYQEQYKALHGRYINFNVDIIQNHGTMDESLLDFDLSRIDEEVRSMIAKFDQSSKDITHDNFVDRPLEARLINAWIDNAQCAVQRMFRKQEYERCMVRCQNGYTTLNLDLSGRLYQCHNDENSFVGTIEDSYDYILENVISLDCTKENCKICKDCPAVYLCNCGCIKMGQEERNSGYCDLRRAIYTPVIEYMLSLADDAAVVV
jgi:uncharacterized protein